MTAEAVEHSYGEATAPMTVLEFGDYECPYCAGAWPVIRELVDTSEGQIRLVFRNFPLFEVHPHALTAALAAESASFSAGEEVFWMMHKALYHHQARLDDGNLRIYAQEVGADPELAAGEAAQQFAPIVQADYTMGIEAGVSATPTLFFNGAVYEGRVDLPSLRRAAGISVGSGGTQSRRGPWQRR